MPERISARLKQCMLLIFMILFGSGVALGVAKGLEYRSYLLAFGAALLVAGIYGLGKGRLEKHSYFCDRARPWTLGLILTGICFFLHLLYVLLVPMEPSVDFATFWNTAVWLAGGEIEANRLYVAAFPHILGYSAFLSLFIRLFGEHYLVAASVNVVLTCLSCALIYWLCLRLSGQRIACFAALLWIVCPSKMMYNAMVLSEPWYTCLLLASMAIMVWLHLRLARGAVKPVISLAAGAAAALCLAAANAARPIAAVVIIAFFLWLFLLRGEKWKDFGQWKSWSVFAVVLLLVYALLGSIWNHWSEKTLGREIPSVPGYNIYVGLNTSYWGSYSPEDMELFQSYLVSGEYTVVEAQEKMLEAAKERLRSGEIDFPTLLAKKLQTFLGCDEGGAYYSQAGLSSLLYSLFAMASNVWYYAIALLVLLAAGKELRSPGESVFSLFPLFVIGLTLAQMLVEVAGRYHYSIIPMLVLIAAKAAGDRNVTKEDKHEAEALSCDSLL